MRVRRLLRKELDRYISILEQSVTHLESLILQRRQALENLRCV